MAKLIRKVRVVTEYYEVGAANSSNEIYWSRDFKVQQRVPAGEPVRTELEGLRPMTALEDALICAPRLGPNETVED